MAGTMRCLTPGRREGSGSRRSRSRGGRCLRLALAVGLGAFGAGAIAECINPILTPRECNYWKERNHLMFNQPATKFWSVEKTDRLLGEMETFYQNYIAGVKVSGDDAIGGARLRAMGALIDVIAIDATNRGMMLANDPFIQKPIYDIGCTAYWQIAIGESCPSSADLPVDPVRMRALLDMFEKLEAIAMNPWRVLGEEWGDVVPDIGEIDAAYDRLKTLGRNVAPGDFDERYADRFQSLDALLAAPIATTDEFTAVMRDTVFPTVLDTTRDTLEGLAAGRGAMRTEDIDELVSLQANSKNAIGRMQVLETGNMLASQGAESWLKIREIYGATTNMMAVDAAQEQYRDDIAGSNSLRLVVDRAVDDPNQVTLDDGERY